MIEGEFKFAFATDIHVSNTTPNDYKLAILNEIGKYGVNLVVCGGDIVDGFEPHEQTMLKLTKSAKELKRQSVADTFICQGNHDTGFVYFYPEQGYGEPSSETALTPKKWHNITCRHLEGKVNFDSENPYGGYYYKDYEDSKIRVININTTDNFFADANGVPYTNPMSHYIQQKQLDWLHRDALNFMDKGEDRVNWGVITVSHRTPPGAVFGNIAEGIFKAYLDGTTYTGADSDITSGATVSVACDFTTQGSMEFICSIGGDRHYDYVVSYSLFQRPQIVVLNANHKVNTNEIPDGATRPTERVEGELSAEAMDIITINKVERTINLTRFGAGTDRIITY